MRIGGRLFGRAGAGDSGQPGDLCYQCNAPPFLIRHGAKDYTVPVAQAETFAEVFRKVGAHYTLLVVSTAGHGLGGRENADRVVAFFNTYLKSAGKQPNSRTAETPISLHRL